MSLVVNGSSNVSYAPIPEGTYIGVCNMLVDLGMQKNEVYKNVSRKVLIGWEIPEETIETEEGTKSRTVNKRYTASLNESANLRQDLAAWRGRDFTDEELAAFDLRNIVGASCLINIVHKRNGERVYANISSIMALPKGMPKGVLSAPPVVYDIDDDPVEMVDKLPRWISETIKKSESYISKYAAKYADEVRLEEVDDDDGELPF